MKNKLFLTLFTLSTLCLMAKSSTAEARPHCGRSSRTSIGVSACTNSVRRDAYVVRRYARAQPVQVVYPAPVFYEGEPCCITPDYYQTVYPVYQAPVYVEEVYVEPRRPVGFGGLSFSWNFFR